ncbi:MAG TPA: hypothetical protein VIL74_02090 [Pyrinomonadaceae bacterium]|jgi:hypothetical protein
MLKRFVAFLKEYESRVKEAYELFREHKGLENPAYWRMLDFEKSGFIDDKHTIAYHFHGKGCRVKLPSGEVDWDFTADGTVGLSVGFLHSFAKRGSEDYPEFRNLETLEGDFQEAILKGVLVRHPNEMSDYTFFLNVGIKDRKSVS